MLVTHLQGHPELVRFGRNAPRSTRQIQKTTKIEAALNIIRTSGEAVTTIEY